MDPHSPDCLSRPLPPSPEPDWGGLHYDILALILKRLKQIEEFVVFGSVCKSWRIVARDNKRCLAPQIPWLMLQENPENEYHRQIYSLPKEDILTKNLYIPELNDKRCIGLNHGWVRTVSRLGGEMNLVHPISRKQIELPPHTSLKGYYGKEPNSFIEGYYGKQTCPSYLFFSRVALCGNPSESSDFMVMAVHGTGNHLYYWKPGCKYWNLVTYPAGTIGDLTCYQDQFYAVRIDGEVFVLKEDHEGSIVPHLIGKVNSEGLCMDPLYIVGSTHGLLVVARELHREEEGGEGFRGVAPRTSQLQEDEEEEEEVDSEEEEEEEEEEGDARDEEEGVLLDVPQEVRDETIYRWERLDYWGEVPGEVPEEFPDEEIEWEGWRYASVKFRVFELDLINCRYKKTRDLGDRAIFVGHNSSICFECVSELPEIKSNHIYFTDDDIEQYVHYSKGGGRDMGIYSLEDGQITQFKINELLHRSRISPPFWFIPSL